jgi:hypothetical protein
VQRPTEKGVHPKKNRNMKLATFCLIIAGALSVQGGCKKDRALSGCYKGRLAVKGICSNYTIQVTGGGIDTALIATHWRDEQTGITHDNVFGLGSVCTFPANLNEGDEFSFTIEKTDVQQCIQCMAYYPTPEKKLFIKVLSEPCTP